MFTVQTLTQRYQPRPGDAPHDLFEARVRICRSCPLRQVHTCRLASQLVSVLARPKNAICPNRSWPGDPPQPAARPQIAATSPPPRREPLQPAVRAPGERRTIPCGPIPYAGVCQRKPWQYEVTAAIPTINSSERLPLVIELLRLQTVRPFIVVVDTGSDETHWPRIESLRADDVEVHALRLNAIENSSEVVSMAMDTIQGLCRTRFLFCTHDDVFLRSRTVLKELRDLAAEHRVAGHRLTRRPHDDWHEMFGHSVLMLDSDFAIDHGLSWNMRRGVRLFGIKRPVAVPKLANWPDTETGLNYLFRLAGIKPVLTGDEKNWARNIDAWIDHCRSSAGGALYRPDHYEKAKEWLAEAMREGWQRVREWRRDSVLEVPPLPDEAPAAQLPLPHFTPGNY